MIELMDSHCHLDFPVFDADRSALIKECESQGISHFIVPAVGVQNWDRLIKLRNSHSEISIAFGLHPYFIANHQEQDLDLLKAYCQSYDPIAVGEIGLDYYDKNLSPEKQLHYFEKQLKIAVSLNLPVILHVRKAHQQVIAMLKQFGLKRGIVHAYSGSYDQAMQYMNLGFKLGFGGAVVNPGANKLRKLAAELPLEAIVLETDSPDMPVFDAKKERNTPLTLLRVLHTFGELRNEDVQAIASVTTQNVHSILPLSL